MAIPKDNRYTREHEWARLEEDETVTVGITEYAQEKLGDIVYVELPKEGDRFSSEDTFGVVESTKAVTDLYSPITGEVIEVNDILLDSPEMINEDPYEEGWMIRLEPLDLDEFNELMSAADYEGYLDELEEEE